MKRKVVPIVFVALIAFCGGVFFRGFLGSGDSGDHQHASEASGAKFYTCSMHPQIQLSDPNAKCPLCGMKLIPVTSEGGEDEGPRELILSPRARALAEVEVAAVERKYVEAEVRMVGKVEYDETKLSYITAWVPGRLDRLYVDYTGVSVEEGDHLVYLYSPELLSAQEELLQSIGTSGALRKSSSEYLQGQSIVSIESSKDKLRLWGLSNAQIDQIIEQGTPSDHITINSPISGVVVHKNAVEGMYVQTGSRIYTVADLSAVWVKLDAYESDLPWVHYGQNVEFRTEAYPGEVFTGRIAFIDPILSPVTRTVKIRVNLSNPDGKLKPEMFVRATVLSRVANGGKVMDPGFAGKWISPMHPEIVKDTPGECDICGMDLVSAESLGYVAADVDEAPLVVPASALLITGKRAVVYVEKEVGKYEGREIEIGPRAGEYYLVRSGLDEGERVVVKGSFKIDSAIQILAKPSMMNPEGGGPAPGHQHHGAPSSGTTPSDVTSHQTDEMAPSKSETYHAPVAFLDQLASVAEQYLKLQYALSHDQFDEAKSAVSPFRDALGVVDMGLLQGDAHLAWMKHADGLKSSLEEIALVGDLAAARNQFGKTSTMLIEALRAFGGVPGKPLNIYHCPMAFKGEGGSWLQDKEGTENPYYGSSMFKCGSLVETIEGHVGEHRNE